MEVASRQDHGGTNRRSLPQARDAATASPSPRHTSGCCVFRSRWGSSDSFSDAIRPSGFPSRPGPNRTSGPHWWSEMLAPYWICFARPVRTASERPGARRPAPAGRGPAGPPLGSTLGSASVAWRHAPRSVPPSPLPRGGAPSAGACPPPGCWVSPTRPRSCRDLSEQRRRGVGHRRDVGVRSLRRRPSPCSHEPCTAPRFDERPRRGGIAPRGSCVGPASVHLPVSGSRLSTASVGHGHGR